MDYDITETSNKLSLKTWAKILPFLKPVRGRLLASVALTLLSAVVDSALPLFTSYAVDNFVVSKSTGGLGRFIAIYLVVIIAQGLITIFFSRHSMVAEMIASKEMKRACFVHLQTLSASYFNKTPVGYILARVMSDTNRICGLIAWALIQFLWDTIYIIGIFVFMFRLNAQLALIIAVVVPLILLATFFFKNKFLNAGRKMRSINSAITGMYNEGITGAKTSKTLVIEDRNSDEFAGVSSDMYKVSMKNARLGAVFIPLVIFFGSLATAAVVQRGGELVMEGVIAFGTLSAFISYALVIMEPVQELANLFSEFIAAQANIERVAHLLEQEPGIVDTSEVTEKYGDFFSPKKENWEHIKGDLEFKDVWFKYPDGDTYILKDFNLKVPAGTTVAIVGSTGAGKSTIVNLVCRFLEPTRGQVLIDGRDYKERSQLWLQSSLGYVLQNPHLFSGSIKENILYGNPNATDTQVKRAAELVSADKIAEKFPQGYATDVGEGGDMLSTGEKQLISFARAIVGNPPIFVLDEATSSIDTETELLIQDAISNILQGRTSFIIAHRLSTIKHADIILVVEQGEIMERGSHDELMSFGGKYAKLYQAMILCEDSELEGFMPNEEEEGE